MDEIIDKICIFGEDSKPIRPLITKVEYTFEEFQKLYAPFCGDAQVHVEATKPAVRTALCGLFYHDPRSVCTTLWSGG